MKVDVHGKNGPIAKTVKVYTNDPRNSVITLSVRMYLKDPAHMSRHTAQEIFQGGCRECHVDQGAGKKGWELFKADCFMCHNAGKNTTLSSMSRQQRKVLERTIREGVENSSMPGFGQKFGGPLDDKEIGSLLDLIKE